MSLEVNFYYTAREMNAHLQPFMLNAQRHFADFYSNKVICLRKSI